MNEDLESLLIWLKTEHLEIKRNDLYKLYTKNIRLSQVERLINEIERRIGLAKKLAGVETKK